MNVSPLLPRQTRLLALLPPDEQMRLLRRLPPKDLLLLDADYESWLHSGQREPNTEGWRTWLMMAGRGYGKTRAGAEWIAKLASKSGRAVRVALVGGNEDEVRKVMIEGPSGLLAVAKPRLRPRWEPSLQRLTWPNGSQAFVYSGENPDSLRGPEHDFAWCDELAKWKRGEECWDNLQMTLRRGERPRTLVTTTPRTIKLLEKIEALPDTVVTRGRTSDNANLPEAFVRAMALTYGGTRLGRQELDGELLADVQGSLWPRALIEASRAAPDAEWHERDFFARVVIGVDPPASQTGDACGIVAIGLGKDGLGYVLGDHSEAGLSPEGWAGRVADACALHEADRVIAEKNMGGDMVEAVLRSVENQMPISMVHASTSKKTRAEPVAALFEKGRAKLAGAFPALEDELAGLTASGGYHGPGKSPDRADAMVWAFTELMLGRRALRPGIRVL